MSLYQVSMWIVRTSPCQIPPHILATVMPFLLECHDSGSYEWWKVSKGFSRQGKVYIVYIFKLTALILVIPLNMFNVYMSRKLLSVHWEAKRPSYHFTRQLTDLPPTYWTSGRHFEPFSFFWDSPGYMEGLEHHACSSQRWSSHYPHAVSGRRSLYCLYWAQW